MANENFALLCAPVEHSGCTQSEGAIVFFFDIIKKFKRRESRNIHALASEKIIVKAQKFVVESTIIPV